MWPSKKFWVTVLFVCVGLFLYRSAPAQCFCGNGCVGGYCTEPHLGGTLCECRRGFAHLVFEDLEVGPRETFEFDFYICPCGRPNCFECLIVYEWEDLNALLEDPFGPLIDFEVILNLRTVAGDFSATMIAPQLGCPNGAFFGGAIYLDELSEPIPCAEPVPAGSYAPAESLRGLIGASRGDPTGGMWSISVRNLGRLNETIRIGSLALFGQSGFATPVEQGTWGTIKSHYQN